MKALGKHVLAEFYNCDKVLINDEKYTEELFITAAKEAGATVIKSAFNKFSPHGVSGVVVISESHLTIHSWPEYGYCAVDVFTCGDLINNDIVMQKLKEGLRAQSVSAAELNRGILNAGVDTTQQQQAARAA